MIRPAEVSAEPRSGVQIVRVKVHMLTKVDERVPVYHSFDEAILTSHRSPSAPTPPR